MLQLWRPRHVTTIERLFDDIFKDSDIRSHYDQMYSPNLNVRETKEKVIVEAELAGLEKDDVKVKFENGALKISGEKKKEKVEQDARHYASEISYGSFTRVIPLNEDYIKTDSISATMKNGLLTIQIDKSEAKKAKDIEVQVS